MWQQHYDMLNDFLGIDDWDAALDSFADHPGIEGACYSLSKEAAIIWSGNLAVEGKATGLRSNSVSPGTIGTPLLKDFTATMGAETIDGAAAWAGRHGRAEEIADALLFLASSESTWISGADLPVDGGFGAYVHRAGAVRDGRADVGKLTRRQGAVRRACRRTAPSHGAISSQPVKPDGSWRPITACSNMPQPTRPSIVAFAMWSMVENGSRARKSWLAVSTTDNDDQFSPFHSPCVHSGSPL
ncbi:SDR family oxidoreductase [Rhodococcus zopfii]|uniref:SDR family oxidoreductase n=1 Tax=Rhodococcus zopfii TaxID=43772 RepID=A0ABU3WPU3_9NOCA|nr:SDR family oxidoreductase [Rhodococcus zopfii]